MAKYKIVTFDLDGVIFSKPWHSDTEEVAVSSWDVLFKELGIYDLHERLKQMFIEKRFKSYMDWTDKVKFVKYIANLYKTNLNEIVYVGDDVNDIPVFKSVGLSIAFNADKKKVRETAKVVIRKKDLREILPYVGLKIEQI